MNGDQQWQGYEPGGRAPEPSSSDAPTSPPANAPRRPATTTATPRSRVGTAVGLSIAAVAVVAVVGSVGAALVSAVQDAVEAPDALSADGLADLRADVAEESGGTEVFRAVIYPEYASLDVPADGSSQRYRSMHWDGDLDEFGSKGTSTYRRIDLADVDATVVADAVAEVRPLVEDAEIWYVVIDSSDPSGGPTLSAHASNEYSESASVTYTLDGTEVRRFVAGEVVRPG